MRKLWCLLLGLVLLSGCAAGSRTTTIFAMDTVMDLTAYGPKAQDALELAQDEVDRIEALISAQRPGSDLYAVNAQSDVTAPTVVAQETADLLARALALGEDTAGALDVTIYPAVEAWGFYSGDYQVPDAQTLEALKARVDFRQVTLDGTQVFAQGHKLDLGAVGKGYAADRIVALWQGMGLTSGLLNLGGNVQCLGAKPDGSDWVIGIRDPADEGGTLCTVSGTDMAVVTSGGYQRNFTQDGVTYHHILDPHTCAPADSGAASVTVIGPSGLTCDALSTALFVMGPDRAAEYWRQHRDFDLVYYTQEGELWYTAGLEGRLTLRDGLEGQMIP